jgi:hypothetical protein
MVSCMRTRLLAHAAALILAAGGLLAMSTSPASAHCDHDSHHPPDRYGGGGIFWDDTPVRFGPHDSCEVLFNILDWRIDVHCAIEATSLNDWIHARAPSVGAFWAREAQFRIPDGKIVRACGDPSQTVYVGNA